MNKKVIMFFVLTALVITYLSTLFLGARIGVSAPENVPKISQMADSILRLVSVFGLAGTSMLVGWLAKK